jgi:CubicO group peptidase (beta-lactamase class C family)
MRDPQKRIQLLLDALVREGRERGVQLAAYAGGVLVVDAWAGVADAATGRPVDGDTLFPVFSATKGLAATLAHLLVERGKIAYDTPLADVWPEFAAHGKRRILLRHALNHTAGLQNLPAGLTRAEMNDWETMCRLLARMEPVSPPGVEMVYHAVTYSWLVGETLRRVDGRPFARLLREEICKPLGISDLYAGIPDAVEPRVAILDEIFAPGAEPRPDPSQPQSVAPWMQPLHQWMNRPDTRRACIPGSNGIMSARALARHYAALVPGGVAGVELLPPHRVCEAATLQTPARIPEGAAPQRRGLGYALGGESSPMGSRASAFGHGGYGGSIGFADPEFRLAVGFTRNFFSPSGGSDPILPALREELGIPA